MQTYPVSQSGLPWIRMLAFTFSCQAALKRRLHALGTQWPVLPRRAARERHSRRPLRKPASIRRALAVAPEEISSDVGKPVPLKLGLAGK
jgi:hypothetical protein